MSSAVRYRRPKRGQATAMVEAVGVASASQRHWPNGGGHKRSLPSQLGPLIVDETMTGCLPRFDDVGYSSHAL